MPRLLLALLLFLPLGLAAQVAPSSSTPEAPPAPGPKVLLHTSLGEITLELYPDKAPKSVANFLQYLHEGFYDGTVFHRAIPGYLVQGGLYTRDLQPKRTHPAIASEADNGLSNLRGTVAVARGGDPNSGTAQFFINLVDNRRLDYAGNQSGLTWGYAVFGHVVDGMDVIDKIAALPTHGQGPFAGDVPTPLPVIESARVIGPQVPAGASSAKPPVPASSVAKPARSTGKTGTKPKAR